MPLSLPGHPLIALCLCGLALTLAPACITSESGASPGTAGASGASGTAGAGGLDASGDEGTHPDGEAGLEADAATSDAVGDQAAETAPVEGVLPLTGSLNLRFEHIDIDAGHPYWWWQVPISDGLEARLDLRKQSGAYEGVFTPRWGEPAAVPVHASNDRIVVGPVVMGPIKCVSGGLSEVWDELVIARGANGLLGQSVDATGTGPHYQPNGSDQMVGSQTPMSGEASLQLDQRAPSVKIETDGALPWSTIKVSLDEGVELTQATTRLQVTADDGGTAAEVATTWAQGAIDTKAAWAGIDVLRGAVNDWDVVSGRTVHVVAAPGIEDLAGNGSLQQDMSFAVLSAGTTVPVHDFGADPSSGLKWGSTSFLTGPDASLCEAASCLLLGPIQVTPLGDAGFAGRIAIAGKHKIAIRYRVFTDGSPAAPSFMDASVALEGLGVVASSPGYVEYNAFECADAQGGLLPCASPWSDLIIDLPQGAAGDEAGITIVPSKSVTNAVNSLQSCGIDASGPHFYTLAILLQRVEALP